MTEAEYIKARDLGIISSAYTILRKLVPENSEIVDVEEYHKVIRLLSKWESSHYSQISTKDLLK